MARVTTPVPGFSGTVAGVVFAGGAGETDDPAALTYFARQGYRIDAGEPTEPPTVTEPPAQPPTVPPAPDADQPAGNASTEEWRAYAVAKGLDAERVDTMTRDQIRDLF